MPLLSKHKLLFLEIVFCRFQKQGGCGHPFREGVNISVVKMITEPMFLDIKGQKLLNPVVLKPK